ncbi:MAG: hypothetical protein ACRD35_01970 [Candidatus Acidiferrales bacterium]
MDTLLAFLQAISGLAIAVLTLFYVVYTKRLLSAYKNTLEELRDQHWAANRAYVNLRIVFNGEICTLAASNEGKSPAQNVHFALDRELLSLGNPNRKIGDMQLFSKPVKSFPAGAEYYVPLWRASSIGTDQFVPDHFKVRVLYDTLNRSIEEDHVLEVRIFQGQSFPPRAVEDLLDRVARDLGEISQYFHRLNFREIFGRPIRPDN